MVAMSDAAEHPHHEHHLLRDLARRAGEHHERAVHRREEAELAILETYLPAQLSDEELAAIAARAVESTGATGMAQMGQVMKAAQAEVAGGLGLVDRGVIIESKIST